MRTFVDYESLWGDLRKQVPFIAAGAATGQSRFSDITHHLTRNEPPVLERLAAGSSRLLRRARIGLRRFLRDVEQHRQARANYEVLRRLDSATLRDLGLTLDEVESVAAEAVGLAERTRRRVETEFWQSASAGFRVRKVELFLSVAVFATFAAVVAVALKAPEILVAWRATVAFI
jgi:uncharacterized protein YjiS (DUF1127 family)